MTIDWQAWVLGIGWTVVMGLAMAVMVLAGDRALAMFGVAETQRRNVAGVLVVVLVLLAVGRVAGAFTWR